MCNTMCSVGGVSTGVTPSDFSKDLSIFRLISWSSAFSLESSNFFQSMYLKKISCLFSNFSTFQPFFKDFQLFLIRKQSITWIFAWRFAVKEWTSVSNLFAPPCCLLLIAAILAMTLFSFLSRNTAMGIMNYLLGWLLLILVGGVIFSSWEKLEDYC